MKTAGTTEDRASPPPERPAWRNVVLLGWVSLLTDTASEMIVPLLPAFLTGVLGAGALALGWIEGVADATASVLKLVSGRWSDRVGRRRPFVLAGYGVSTVARPVIALAGAAWHVLALRTLDRVGKGLRSSPRDAIVAASVPAERRGAAFGLQRGMDHAGAVLGPLVATALLAAAWDLRSIFLFAALPGLAAVGVILGGVREVAPTTPLPQRAVAPHDRAASGAGRGGAPPPSTAGLWRVLLPIGLFTLGNASDVFLLLQAGATRAPLVSLPLLWMALHVVKMLVSPLGGHLADRWGRRRIIAAGWVVYALVYAGFAFAQDLGAVAALFVIYGVYHGLTEGAERALVAELAPDGLRGTAFGWYHLTQGGGALAASLLFGGLWELFGSRAAFLTSAGIAGAAVLALALAAPGRGPGGDAVHA